jgi:SAM-dependent methyltransferase
MRAASALYRLLGDEARLRILRLLSRERLNVSELTAVLGIAQSGVSRHLGLLKESGLVQEQREGGFTYYRVAPDAAANGLRPVWAALVEQFAAFGDDPVLKADTARLKEVLRLRKESFATHGGAERQLVPGRSWAAWSRALGLLLPALDVADVGCGEGYLTIETARWARRVVAIDRSRKVLDRARALAKRRGVSNIAWKRGEIESLPLEAESIDLVLLSQALHHASDPVRAIAEAARVLRPGGRVLVLDLRRHGETWVRERLGDQVLGFDEDELAALLAGAELADVQVRVGARLEGDPFAVLIACGTKKRRRASAEESGQVRPSPRAASQRHSQSGTRQPRPDTAS